MSVRDLMIVAILVAFSWIGLHDLLGGEFRTGVAAVCLAIANALLLL